MTTTTRLPTPRPMLADNAESLHIETLLASDLYVTQRKVDGDRVMVQIIDGDVRAYGRNGQRKINNVPAHMLAPFYAFTDGHFVFDGEAVGGVLYLFDLPVADGLLDPRATFEERFLVLTSAVRVLASPYLVLVPVAEGETAKRAMLEDAEANHHEGIMFRRKDARYEMGYRSPHLLKHKFTKTADVIVINSGSDGKDSATLGVYDDDRTLRVVGKASTIGKNKRGGGIKAGMVVEVKYLYVMDEDNPHMYQPRIMSVRDDKDMHECKLEQFRGMATNKAMS